MTRPGTPARTRTKNAAREAAGLLAAACLGSLAALSVLTLLGSTGAPPSTQAWAHEDDRAGRLRRSAEEPVICWPESDGTLGCEPEELESMPGFPDGDDFKQVKVARTHLCALSDDLAITCWGWGACDLGECDSPEGAFVGFNVGVVANCALRASGEVQCWGHDGLEEP